MTTDARFSDDAALVDEMIRSRSTSDEERPHRRAEEVGGDNRVDDEAPRILLVEDDPLIARPVRTLLGIQGYRVDIVATAVAALEHARSGGYDTILLDWELPDGQGPDVVRQLRRDGIPTPVMMVTGRAAVSDQVHAVVAGADEYLVKPFDAQELVERVARLLRRARARRD